MRRLSALLATRPVFGTLGQRMASSPETPAEGAHVLFRREDDRPWRDDGPQLERSVLADVAAPKPTRPARITFSRLVSKHMTDLLSPGGPIDGTLRCVGRFGRYCPVRKVSGG
jgi:hypothetical protein